MIYKLAFERLKGVITLAHTCRTLDQAGTSTAKDFIKKLAIQFFYKNLFFDVTTIFFYFFVNFKTA